MPSVSVCFKKRSIADFKLHSFLYFQYLSTFMNISKINSDFNKDLVAFSEFSAVVTNFAVCALIVQSFMIFDRT